MDVLIVGAGGHGQVIAEALWRCWDRDGTVRPLGYLDDDEELRGRKLVNIPVMGPIAALFDVSRDASVVVAIGDNRTRKRVFDRLALSGARFASVRHPSAIVAPDVRIGAGSMLCAGVIVNVGSVIGEDVILNTGSTIDHHTRLGDHVHLAPGVHMGGDVTVDEGALIGVGASVLPSGQVGAWSIVGGGACVTRPVPPGTRVVGVPAREIARG